MLEANELAFLKLLNEQPAFRENLPPIASRNASASGTDIDGYLSEGHGVSVFAREGDTVYHCYSSYARGTEFLMGYYAILDRVPGAQEDDQVSSSSAATTNTNASNGLSRFGFSRMRDASPHRRGSRSTSETGGANGRDNR